MALAEVQKVEILAHAGIKMRLMSSLQEEGIIHVVRTRTEELGLSASSHETIDLDRILARLQRAVDFLSQWEKKSLKNRFLGNKPQLERHKREEVLRYDYEAVLDEAEKLEERKNDLAAKIKFYDREEEFLNPLSGLPLPVHQVKPTESTEVFLGTIPTSQLEALEEKTAEECLWYEVVSRTKRSAYLFLLYSKSEESRIDQILKELHFNPIYFTESMLRLADPEDGVRDLMKKVDLNKHEALRQLEECDEQGLKLSGRLERLKLAHDVLGNERKKVLFSRFLGETDRILFLEGWIRSADIGKLKSKIKPLDDQIQVYFRDSLPEEEPPAVLTNPKAGKPFEIITKLYGLPQAGTLDPTLALAPFFFLFVGITVSEAGYGFLVVLVSLIYLKLAKPKGGFRQFLQLLAILAVSAVILGTLIGGWFGFPVRKLMVLDPLRDPLTFLILALGLGFIQVWFGTLLNMLYGIKTKEYLQAFFVQGGWLLLLPSLVLYGITKSSTWGILTLVGAAGIVFFAAPSRNPFARFFGGLYSLYDISRYLADILSYSRLLALGLATSVIAMVVNTLCQTAWKIPWVGWLFAALIFVGGHLFNLAISFLGGFVHSMRLQFVEFFSKFFKAGGKPFEPMELEGKYIEFI